MYFFFHSIISILCAYFINKFYACIELLEISKKYFIVFMASERLGLGVGGGGW